MLDYSAPSAYAANLADAQDRGGFDASRLLTARTGKIVAPAPEAPDQAEAIPSADTPAGARTGCRAEGGDALRTGDGAARTAGAQASMPVATTAGQASLPRAAEDLAQNQTPEPKYSWVPTSMQ